MQPRLTVAAPRQTAAAHFTQPVASPGGARLTRLHEISQKSLNFYINTINWKTENCQTGVNAQAPRGARAPVSHSW